MSSLPARRDSPRWPAEPPRRRRNWLLIGSLLLNFAIWAALLLFGTGWLLGVLAP